MRIPAVAAIGLATVLGAACSGSPAASSVADSFPSPSENVRLLVDTDVAPDDLVALAFLVAAPHVEIAAITVVGTGEAHCPRGVEIVLALLERLQAPDIPVACGADEPMSLDHAFPDEFRANADAAAGLDLPETQRLPAEGDAMTLIASTLEDGDVTIVTLGPLTNLAMAIARDASVADRVGRVVVMGGAIEVPGNVAGSPGAPADNTSAEWNIYADPAALQAVLDAVPRVTLVSLDGTNQVPLTTDFAQRVEAEASAPSLTVLAEMLERNAYMTSGSYYLWDVLAAMVAATYPVGDLSDARIAVDVAEGPTSGATQRVDGTPNANYLSTAGAALVEDLIISVMNGG